MNDLRSKRNSLLSATDYLHYYKIAHCTDAQVAEWVVYRQATKRYYEWLNNKR
jgi:hypothetical protein